jgi:hypothetical protein
MSFKKILLINLLWLWSLIFILLYYLIGNTEFGSWTLYKVLQRYLLLPNLLVLLGQLIVWKKHSFLLKVNFLGWISTFIATFYYNLDANILFFVKTSTIYYTFFILSFLVPFLLIAQIAVWLFFLFRRNTIG